MPMVKKFFQSLGSHIFEYLKTTDKVLLLMAVAASTLSCLLIYSLYPEAITSFSPLITQIGASLVGLAIAIFLSVLDYQALAKMWKIYAPAAVGLCLLVFTPLGQMRGGTGMGSDDMNWLNLGFITIQPSEFLKVAFILTFSLHCYTVHKEINKPRNLLFLLLHAAIPIGIIAIQGDFGTMLIFLCIFVSILFAAGINWKVVLGGIGVAIVGGTLFWTFMMPSYLKERFTAVYNLDATKLGAGLQQYQGRITLGSGQMFGKGFSSDNLLTSTPELYNDMMFAHIGQVLGFVGCFAVAAWLAIMSIRILQNAYRAQDRLGMYICVGVFAVIFFQSLINIGMVLCVFPVVGVTLPLFSAGGSSVLSTYMCLGLAICVHNNTARNHMF